MEVWLSGWLQVGILSSRRLALCCHRYGSGFAAGRCTSGTTIKLAAVLLPGFPHLLPIPGGPCAAVNADLLPCITDRLAGEPGGLQGTSQEGTCRAEGQARPGQARTGQGRAGWAWQDQDGCVRLCIVA